MGFTFDDTSPEATPVAETHRLMEGDPRNAEVLFPYIGGEEVNSSPTHAHHRFVIDFFGRSEEETWQWPDLMKIVKEKVKPVREVQNRDALRERWWQYAEKRPGLVSAIAGLERVLVISRVTEHTGFAFMPNGVVFADRLIVFPFQTYAAFCALQSRPHEIWARFFSATLEDRLMYAPSDCFETFPFPPGWDVDPALETTGQTYYEFRAGVMVRHSHGLTNTYNRFHGPGERDPDILKLRELHAAMDLAALDAYGWTDLRPTWEFLLDYDDKGDTGEEGPRRRRKPWRYRWPDDLRDEVLARMLELNRKLAEQERAPGNRAAAEKKPAKLPRGKPVPPGPSHLF